MVRLADISNQLLINRLESNVFLSNLNVDDLELRGVIKFSIGYPTQDKILEVIQAIKTQTKSFAALI